MKKTSIRQMYFYTMICYIFTLICGVAGCIIMLIYSNEFISDAGKIRGIIFFVGILIAFIFLILFSLKVLITLFKDYNAVKNNNFISITAKVIKFKKNIEPESGAQINDKPVVMILDTKEEIVLNINDSIMVGGTYKFNYLKNCKIAELIEN